jgi:hypothetical protein
MTQTDQVNAAIERIKLSASSTTDNYISCLAVDAALALAGVGGDPDIVKLAATRPEGAVMHLHRKLHLAKVLD